jgi:hypothetical protein
MPVKNWMMLELNRRFDNHGIHETADKELRRFEPGTGLQLGWVLPDKTRQDTVQRHIDTIPDGVREAYRAVLYRALTSDPPIAVIHNWEPAYDFALKVTQTPHTLLSPGVITVILYGRYPTDPHPMRRHIDEYAQSARKRASKRAAKRGARPAKRRPSRRP